MSCPFCKTFWEIKELPDVFICGKFGDTWEILITLDNIKIKSILWAAVEQFINVLKY